MCLDCWPNVALFRGEGVMTYDLRIYWSLCVCHMWSVSHYEELLLIFLSCVHFHFVSLLCHSLNLLSNHLNATLEKCFLPPLHSLPTPLCALLTTPPYAFLMQTITQSAPSVLHPGIALATGNGQFGCSDSFPPALLLCPPTMQGM